MKKLKKYLTIAFLTATAIIVTLGVTTALMSNNQHIQQLVANQQHQGE